MKDTSINDLFNCDLVDDSKFKVLEDMSKEELVTRLEDSYQQILKGECHASDEVIKMIDEGFFRNK